MTGFEKRGDHELVLELAHPVGNLFDLFEFMIVADRHTVEEAVKGKKVNGTGPFRFKEWRPGTGLSLTRNDKYWVPDRPYLDAVEFASTPRPMRCCRLCAPVRPSSRTTSPASITSATEPLTATTIERRDVGPHDILIEIKYAGICHSDIHHVRGDWGPQTYPVTPGHEIAGIVTAVGSEVTEHAVGDRVGVGCVVDSCRECANCLKGEEQFCRKGNTFTYGSMDKDGKLTHGGYSTHVVVTEDFVVKIPEGIELDEAAPLLCAGITTYSRLRRWGAGPGKKVAVVGFGGLGHMTVKLAHALGAEVTVLSQSLKKQDDGLRLGADHYHATSDPATFEELAGSFDLIVNTVSAKLDLDAYLSLLAVGGAMVNVGAPAEPLSLSAFSLIMGGRSYAGSLIGGIREAQEMLDFCGEHGIGAEIEVIPADKINEAYERVLASDVRYRFVIDIAKTLV